jgi:hypothetical protein
MPPVFVDLIRVNPRLMILDPHEMACVVDNKHAYKPIVAQIESCNATVCGGNPHRLEFGRIERTH